MQAPRWIVHLFDPAQAFLESGRPDRHQVGPRRHGPAYREVASFGPAVPGGHRPLTEEELAPLRSQAAAHRAAYDEAVARVEARLQEPLMARASGLASTGEATIPTSVGDVAARIVRFRRGDSVLVIESHALTGGGRESKTRLTSGQENDRRLLCGYLVRAIAHFGSDVELRDGPSS